MDRSTVATRQRHRRRAGPLRGVPTGLPPAGGAAGVLLRADAAGRRGCPDHLRAFQLLCVDPIEKKPLNHFLPGSPVLSFGTAGPAWSCSTTRRSLTPRSPSEPAHPAAGVPGCAASLRAWACSRPPAGRSRRSRATGYRPPAPCPAARALRRPPGRPRGCEADLRWLSRAGGPPRVEPWPAAGRPRCLGCWTSADRQRERIRRRGEPIPAYLTSAGKNAAPSRRRHPPAAPPVRGHASDPRRGVGAVRRAERGRRAVAVRGRAGHAGWGSDQQLVPQAWSGRFSVNTSMTTMPARGPMSLRRP
jgi:hypothetical protein